jgi:uncharacterized protein
VNSRRVYRDWVGGDGLVSYTVTVDSTDLQISTSTDLSRLALDAATRARRDIEAFIQTHPHFATSLDPVSVPGSAPILARIMADAGRAAGVGPMAAVAGAIAEAVGRELLQHSAEVMVENGGDVFLATKQPRTVGLYAGSSPLTGRIGIAIAPGDTPLGICTSSGTFGHSLSFGRVDACVVLARSTALADAVATSLANRIRSTADLSSPSLWSAVPEGVTGVFATIEGQVAVWHDVHLVPLKTSA